MRNYLGTNMLGKMSVGFVRRKRGKPKPIWDTIRHRKGWFGTERTQSEPNRLGIAAKETAWRRLADSASDATPETARAWQARLQRTLKRKASKPSKRCADGKHSARLVGLGSQSSTIKKASKPSKPSKVHFEVWKEHEKIGSMRERIRSQKSGGGGDSGTEVDMRTLYKKYGFCQTNPTEKCTCVST